VSCKLFDHKQVQLVFYQHKHKQTGLLRLSNTFLNEKLLEFSVEIAARRAHVFSLLCHNNDLVTDVTRERNSTAIREALNTYRSLTEMMFKNAAGGGT
jgi:hypothetical protein